MKALFETIKIKNYTFKNRVVMPPMCMYMVEKQDGFVTDFHEVHYGSKALGGPALIIVESTGVTADGRITVNDLGIYDDRHVKGLTKLAKLIHDGNAIAGIQINHAGRKAQVKDNVAPSAIAYSDRYNVPKELTEDEIIEIAHAFGQAAKRAHDAGFDLFEIHGAHGYLINQFLSPLTNKRKDKYQDGLLFLKLILDQVVKYWPKDKILQLRISAFEYHDEGLTPQHWVAFLNALKDYPIDIIHVSSGGTILAKIDTYPGYQIKYALDIKKNTHYPVIGGGLISQIEQANQVIKDGLDFVFLGRKLLRDPYFLIHYQQDLLHKAYIRSKV